MTKAWTATVADALAREDGPFWDNLKTSPEWSAYEAQITKILSRATSQPRPLEDQQTKEQA